MSRKATHEIPAKLLSHMRDSGLRLTSARKSMLELLIFEHGPFSCEEVFERIQDRVLCDLVTVYRSLAKFEQVGMIESCELGDGRTRYKFKHSKVRHHHHIICKVCKRIESIPTCKVAEANAIPKKLGFREISHRLEFFGICSDC